MNRKVLLWVSTICIVLSSCSFSSARGQKGFEKVISLSGTNWNISDSLNKVGSMFLTEKWLVIKDNNNETFFALYGLDNHSTIHRFGRPGQGPKEVLSSMPLIVHGDTIDLFDDDREALLRFNINDIIGGEQGVSEVVLKASSVSTFRCVEFPEGDILVNNGLYYEGGRFCLLNYQGEVISYTGEYPQEEPKVDYPFWVLFPAYQGQMLRQPHGNRFAICTYNAELLEIYECDFKEKNIKRTFMRCNSYPYIKTALSNGLPAYVDSEHTTFGYCDMYVTDKYIYTVYSGRKNDKTREALMGNMVQVFDWEGNAICIFELDQDVDFITGNDEVMYAHVVTDDRGDDIREYKLNFID